MILPDPARVDAGQKEISMPKLPPVIYVKWEPDNPPFLSADVTLKAMTESEPVRIGVYRLHEELDLRSVEEVRKKGSRRWFR